MSRKTLLLIILGVCIGFYPGPAFADYKVGQAVEFRDDFQSYGGGWIPAVITEDHGPAAVERYVVRIDPWGEKCARVGGLRPTDGSPRMIPKTPAENNYRGPDADAVADAATARRKAQAAAFANLQGPSVQNPVAVTGNAIPRREPAPQVRAETTRKSAPPNSIAAVLGRGMFPNGKPLGTPGQTNYLPNANGQKSIVCVAPPGEESFLGRWNLKAGGAWTTVLGSEKDLGNGRTQSTLEYSFPVAADVLVVNADGTWFKQFAGKRTTGSWIDLGQNVVQLVGFDEDDWTGSVIKGQMEIRSPLGMWEYGKRF